MRPDFLPTTNGRGYAGGPVTKAPEWHGLVAWDMLFNNLTTGLFLVAATGELAAPLVFTALARMAYPIALVFLIADLICLVLDLGDPLRFHHMLRVFKPSSPMSLGTWLLTIYSAPLTVAAALSLLPEEANWEGARKVAVLLGLLPALGSAVYKGVLLSTNAQPGWRDARWLGAYSTNSALVLGCAEMLALSLWIGHDDAAGLLRPALGLLLAINVIPLWLLIVNIWPALHRAYPYPKLLGVGALALGGGMLAPFCLVLAGGSYALLTAVVLLIFGSLIIRYTIVMLPHQQGEPAA